MNRRSTALTVAVVCLVALFGVAFLAPMPYVLLSPGPTENTLGAFGDKDVITISGHRTFPTTGELKLTTVSETRADYHVRLPQVLDAWWSKDQIVVPRDVVYPPDQSAQQVQQQNNQQMLDSQSLAVIAGLGAAGIDAVAVKVSEVVDNTPAQGVLQVGDEIVSVDGKRIERSSQVSAAVGGLAPGTPVRVGYVRASVAHTVTITTKQNPDDAAKSLIGVQLQDEYNPPFKVSINLGQAIGGPSAGMIFSLAIYDKLTPGSLTGGQVIAGTGTIDENGNVGEIGGIQQKIAGAYDDGARIFLVPAANCEEAAASSLAGTVVLVQVSTLDDAVKALRALDAGNDGAITRCGAA